jgi:hypothetical protein
MIGFLSGLLVALVGAVLVVGYWLVVVWAACGAVVLLTVAAFIAQDWWQARCECDRLGNLFSARAISLERPFDWDDQLERAFWMPAAPDPQWRVL